MMLFNTGMKSQRGAMFGLDARIAMAIFGALALVVGVSVFMTIPQIQAKSLVQDIATYRAAVEGMQYDVRQSISDIITGGGDADIKRFQALNDRGVLIASAQNSWMGPYIRSRTNDSTIHENFGQMYLIEADTTDYTVTACSFCSYWLRIDDVPQNTFNIVNDEIDGAGEASAATSGKVRWAADNGVDPDRLYVRLANVL